MVLQGFMTGHLWHLRNAGFAAALTTLVLACGAPAHVESATNAAPPQEAVASGFSDDDKGWAKYHSKRFSLSLPMPDGRNWKIDDHSRPELTATHPATRSTLVFGITNEGELMNRQKCEERARQQGLVPARDLRTVDDEVTVGPEAFDTRVWVALEPGKTEAAPIVGHLFAFGAYVRRCMFFHLTSEVGAAKDESVLSSRLATARVRMLGGITVDDFDAVPREKPQNTR
jgi:hypothetical protein